MISTTCDHCNTTRPVTHEYCAADAMRRICNCCISRMNHVLRLRHADEPIESIDSMELMESAS